MIGIGQLRSKVRIGGEQHRADRPDTRRNCQTACLFIPVCMDKAWIAWQDRIMTTGQASVVRLVEENMRRFGLYPFRLKDIRPGCKSGQNYQRAQDGADHNVQGLRQEAVDQDRLLKMCCPGGSD